MSGNHNSVPRWNDAVSMLSALAGGSGHGPTFRFLDDSGNEAADRSVPQLAANACAICGQLRNRFAPGSRLVLAYSAGLDFIDAFFGCLMAGMIAVPLPLPKRRRVDERFSSVVRDCKAAACLTTHADREAIVATQEVMANRFEVLETDRFPSGGGFTFSWTPKPDQVAYLQYTSGSTGTPRGAIITHRNLMANLEMIARGFEFTESERLVSWLPHYHDMGLVGDTLTPLYSRMHCIKMSPQSFMREPLTWLTAVTKHRATTIGAPNFAYELCARAATRETTQSLDLRSLEHAYCGAEPIHPDTAYRFHQAFATSGFNRNAFRPCYGLAEATLCVTVGKRLSPLNVRSRPESDSIAPRTDRPVVGCGRPVPRCEVHIADQHSGARLADGRIGEVLVSGDHVSRGYWGKVDVVEGRVEGGSKAVSLRTGDLGFIESGELYITGRKKDMMIVGGRNLYPQDVERSAAGAHPAVEACVSFAVDTDAGEKVVVLAEVNRSCRNGDLTPVRRAIHQAILKEHELSIADLLFVNPLSIPRTSSGKVRRFACREHYLSHTVPGMIQTSKTRRPSAASTNGRSTLVTDYICGWASRNLGVEATSITSSSKLSELGLDSLRAVDLQLSLLRDCGLSVSPAALADGVSVGELARRSSQFVVPSGPPLAVLPARETVDIRFNVMPERFVQEILLTKAYRIWKGYAEAVFDRDYKSEMLASPDHLVFLTALTHTQKLAYVCMAYELGFPHEPTQKEQFKFWPTDVRVTMPQMVTQSSDLRQQLWVYDKRHVCGNKYQVRCRTLIGSMEIMIDSTMLMIEPASSNGAKGTAHSKRSGKNSAGVRRAGSVVLGRNK